MVKLVLYILKDSRTTLDTYANVINTYANRNMRFNRKYEITRQLKPSKLKNYCKTIYFKGNSYNIIYL